MGPQMLVLGLFDTCPACELVADQVGLKKKRDDLILNDYPEDLKEDYLFLSDWVRELSQKYREDIRIKLIDAQSLPGLLKSIRYGIFRYPTFIIDKKKKYSGRDKDRLDTLLREHIRNS